MKRFKNILYILGDNNDISSSTTAKVQELARLNGASVTIVRIEEGSIADDIAKFFAGTSKKLSDAAVAQHESVIEDTLNDPGWRDIELSNAVLTGRGFIAVIQKVLRDRHDLVIKEDRSERGLEQLSMRLIRKCPCPVWVIRQKHGGGFKRILAAVDLSSDNPETLILNKKIIELCHSLAQRESGEAHYVHAWQLEYESMLRGPRFNVKTDEIAKIKKQLQVERKSIVDNLFHEALITPKEENVHLIEGETVAVIEKMLDTLRVDVIVMGTVGRTGISGLLIGNKAEKLLSDIHCTVLAVKPEGFISPVTLTQE